MDVRTMSSAHWPMVLNQELEKLDTLYPECFGVYVKDLRSGEFLSFKGTQPWYIASGVKLPVAVEVLRQVDSGRFSMDNTIELRTEDFVDGNGETNFQPVGSRLTVLYLLEQMLIYSDNTATDLLIRTVGLQNINTRVKKLIPEGFGEITTLGDVRRHVYSQLHASAAKLRGKDFLTLKKIADEHEKKVQLAQLLAVNPGELSPKSIDEAYESYYKLGLNSATLTAYGQLIEAVVYGHALSTDSTEKLLEIMSRVQTGVRRIKAAFPKPYVWAHKTGTQYKRACDFGIIQRKNAEIVNLALIAACTRGFATLETAESVLKRIGQAVVECGLLDNQEENR
ncbi:MAG: serine hydrolase [Bdellovibrionales bacterium]